MRRYFKSVEERFWEKVDKYGPVSEYDGQRCWSWKGSKHPKTGHGYFRLPDKSEIYAHRVMWKWTYGDVRDGLYVCHNCDVSSCVRPDHLYLATHLQNDRDRSLRGRTKNSHTGKIHTNRYKSEMPVKTLGERFVERVDKNGPVSLYDGKPCWIWKGHENNEGYGTLSVAGKPLLAHRTSYEMYCGEIGSGLLVCHGCDNPRCVNPNHLFLGTHKDNGRDMSLKGRSYFQRNPRNQYGEKNYQAKLTKVDVIEIRKLYASGQYNQYELAEMYKMGQVNISRIVNGVRWGHVK